MSHEQASHFRYTVEASSTPNEASNGQNDSTGKYYEELWQACAGPLVSIPKLGQLVMYIPQGHIEQIHASTYGGVDRPELPMHDLPHIPCTVMHYDLGADPETDEVHAQLSLQPGTKGSKSQAAVVEKGVLMPSSTNKATVQFFCKTLTASDTSTHGGFSVPRKYASCLPPLDMTQNTPTQELVATDLHGVKWHFRHIYRGQPKRHLLTTGWSVFVSQKKLVTGDAVIFLRGEDGELRVGIRRALRQKNISSSSVLPSQSLQMGVIATATHAIVTNSLFCIYYKPRVSPAELVIPMERFQSSLCANLAVGMRFKMRFEGEDASERRYDGTITGIEDFNQSKWPSSKWRSLKVGWDEPTAIHEHHHRVSPWEIELCEKPVTPSVCAPGARCKRVRASTPISSQAAEAGSLESSGRSKAGFGSMPRVGSPTVLQGQAPWALSISAEDEYHANYRPFSPSRHLFPQELYSQASSLPLFQQPGSENGQGNKELLWKLARLDDSKRYQSSAAFATSQQQQQQQSPFDASMEFVSAVPVPSNYRSSGYSPLVLSNQYSTVGPSRPGTPSSNWQTSSGQYLGGCLPITDSSPIWLGTSSLSSPLPSPSISSLSTTLRIGNMGSQQTMQGQGLHLNKLCPSFTWQENKRQEAAVEPERAPIAAVGSAGCKLFGFSLTDPPSSAHKATVAMKTMMEKDQQAVELDSSRRYMLGREVEHSGKEASAMSLSATSSEREFRRPATSHNKVRQGQCKGRFEGRSCTKVVKKGSTVCRGVDLSKFSGYEQLFEQLERMFHLEGQLRDKEKVWQVAYSDFENDMLQVGDDPWGEFCTLVKKIHILSKDDVKQDSKLIPKPPS
ncbi:hypothetical protein L7F22_049579 [Adiantum nelumboides]|nr:hypothetical protein [Adiantum nelumboides]